MSIIHIEDLTVAYQSKPVLWDIDLDFQENSITAIVGPNGAGKSTLLKSILGFIKPLSGKVTFYNQPLEKILKRVSYVPQYSAVNWDFPITVFDVVMMGCYKEKRWFNFSNKKQKDLVLEALNEMGLSELKDRQISELSGGQKQRVFIARALTANSDLLIMDEPLAGVDKFSEKIIMDKIKYLQKQGKTIICVHHDLNTLNDYFDHIVLINRYIIKNDKIENITKEDIAKAYMERKDVRDI